MEKKEFIVKAKQRLKQRNAEKPKVKELYFYHDRYLTLHAWFEDGKIKHRWIQLENVLILVTETEQVLGRYLSNDEDNYDEIIAILKKELAENPDGMLDYVEGIDVWEKVELSFTVREFCKMAEITIDEAEEVKES